MRQLKLAIAGGVILGALGLNAFLAFQLSNALFLAPSIAAASIAALLFHRPSWFVIFLLLAFFDIRGEIAAAPVHLWEIHVFAAALFLLPRRHQGTINRIEIALFVLFGVAVLSAVLNSNYQQGLKSAARWLEYLVIYRTVRFAAAPLFTKVPALSLSHLLVVPLIALAFFSTIQASVIKGDWIRVLEGRYGTMILGPTESKNRTLKNNFDYSGEHGDAFRAPGFYLSAVDLSAVLMISIATLYLKGQRAPLSVAALLLGGAALILSMGRASLLYGGISLIFATLIYQRQARTMAALFIALIVLSAGLLAYAPARERLFSLTDTEQNTEEERTLIWQTGLNIWKSSPIYGKGGGSTSSLFDENASVDWLAGKQGSTHSTYIGTLAELGVLGLAAWLYFIWTLGREFIKRPLPAETKSLLCFCLLFFVIMGVSSDTYTAGNPYFVLLLILFGWYRHESDFSPPESDGLGYFQTTGGAATGGNLNLREAETPALVQWNSKFTP